MTPPFGYNLFLMRAMALPEMKLKDIYTSIIPFVLVMVAALAIVMTLRRPRCGCQNTSKDTNKKTQRRSTIR